MSLETLWLQNIDYAARLDRLAFDAIFLDEGVVGGNSFRVTVNANMTLDIATGRAVVQGDNETNQGKYIVRNTATKQVTLSTGPGSGQSRIDLVVLQVRDPQAGGSAGDDAIVSVVAGTAGVSPSAPAVPNSALVLAQVLVGTSVTVLTQGNITDRRVLTAPASPCGTIMAFAGSTAPAGYLVCDGSAISRTTYADLFQTIGTAYGAGNGSTTFNLPNLKGRVPYGYDSADGHFDTLGETGGSKSHTISEANLPSHSHGAGTLATASSGSHAHDVGSVYGTTYGDNRAHNHAIGGTLAQSGDAFGAGFTGPGAPVVGAAMTAGSHTHSMSGSTAATGSGTAINHLPPFLVFNYIIKT